MTLARGHFDQLQKENGSFRIRGWMFVPDTPLSEFRVSIDDTPRETCAPSPRDDVFRAYSTVPHAGRSGFDFLLTDLPESGRIEIEGRRDGATVARLRSLFRTDLDDVIPAPPGPLLARAIATESAAYYRAEGLRAYAQFKEALERHRPLSSIGRMLDWGCGSGRNTVHFLRDPDVPEVHGCDIDGEAIEWCRRNLPNGIFAEARPDPPLCYDDGFFDLVIGCSVFTHLSEDMQGTWLTELRRILAPGGLLLASVHGEFAAELHFRGLGPVRRRLQNLRWATHGFVDLGEDPRLDRAAPPGYYRAVFQSRRHTMRRWSRTLEIVDYLPAGIQAHQDLVVLRRTA